MGPSRFLRQHVAGVEEPRVDGSAFRLHWRVKTRVDKLFAAGRIDARTWQAAVAYRDLHSRAYAGLIGALRLDGTGRAPHRGGSRLEPSEAQVDAIEQLSRITRELGPVASSLLEEVVLEDRSWSAIGRRLHIDRKTAQAWAITTLEALAARS